jgi:hypothetical protein
LFTVLTKPDDVLARGTFSEAGGQLSAKGHMVNCDRQLPAGSTTMAAPHTLTIDFNG